MAPDPIPRDVQSLNNVLDGEKHILGSHLLNACCDCHTASPKAKQPVSAFDRQREHIRDLKQHAQHGMVSGTAQVRQYVLRDQFPTFEGIALTVVRRRDLPMQFAEMSKNRKNLGAGNVSIHGEGLLL